MAKNGTEPNDEKRIGDMTEKELREFCKELQKKNKSIDEIVREVRQRFEEKGIREDFSDYDIVSLVAPHDERPSSK